MVRLNCFVNQIQNKYKLKIILEVYKASTTIKMKICKYNFVQNHALLFKASTIKSNKLYNVLEDEGEKIYLTISFTNYITIRKI